MNISTNSSGAKIASSYFLHWSNQLLFFSNVHKSVHAPSFICTRLNFQKVNQILSIKILLQLLAHGVPTRQSFLRTKQTFHQCWVTVVRRLTCGSSGTVEPFARVIQNNKGTAFVPSLQMNTAFSCDTYYTPSYRLTDTAKPTSKGQRECYTREN